MNRTLITAAAALGFALAAQAPALALTGDSQPDHAHANVGVMLPSPNAPVPRTCTVTLVSSRVGVMAGHCVALRAALLGEHDGTISFDRDLRDGISGPTYHGSLLLDPLYGPPGTAKHDIGLIVLDQPVSGITPEPLPPVGYLDSVSRRGTMAEIVGYGNTTRLPGNAKIGAGERRSGWAFVDRISPLELGVHATASSDTAAGCDQDSGSPMFVEGTFAAVLAVGDAACASATAGQRIDTAFEGSWIRSVIADNN